MQNRFAQSKLKKKKKYFFNSFFQKQLDDTAKNDKSHQRWKLDPMFLGSVQNANQSVVEWSSNSSFIDEIRRQKATNNNTQINIDNIAIEIRDVQ